MDGASPPSFPISSNPSGVAIPVGLGLNGTPIPAEAEAIAKADTGAYLSTSAGNAFSTRTASQIIQDHFNPGTAYAPSGPLYGVQFSALPCSDLVVRWTIPDPSSQTRGPHRSPLGLAGDPGGFPLYKNGVLVGGVGVKAVGAYGVVTNTQSTAQNTDELLALAGTIGLDAPNAIRANNITVGGLLLHYSNAAPGNLIANPSDAPPFSSLPPGLLSLPSYFYAPGGLLAGTPIGVVASGLVADPTGLISVAEPPNMLVDGDGSWRYPPRAGAASAGSLSQGEVTQILRSAYGVALMARANLRPAGQHAAVTISVVDVYGTVLGVVSVPDAALFGVDVSLQKARSAVFLSNSAANGALTSAQAGGTISRFATSANLVFGSTIFAQSHGWSERAIGTIARDTLPDGINGTRNGPFSLAANETTPFSDGLQLALVFNNLVQHVLFLENPYYEHDTAPFCTPLPGLSGSPYPVISNGLQVFAGGFPIFRGNTLVGGIGVSGDGVDQDDLVAFLGLYNAGVALGSGIGNAPPGLRANLLSAAGVRPVYANCPAAPFLSGGAENVCSGK
jgi:uncharacterized protein GlcG (DUF336 family)